MLNKAVCFPDLKKKIITPNKNVHIKWNKQTKLEE